MGKKTFRRRLLSDENLCPVPELAGEFRLDDFFLRKQAIEQVNFVVQSISSLLDTVLAVRSIPIELLLLDVRNFS